MLIKEIMNDKKKPAKTLKHEFKLQKYHSRKKISIKKNKKKSWMPIKLPKIIFILQNSQIHPSQLVPSSQVNELTLKT